MFYGSFYQNLLLPLKISPNAPLAHIVAKRAETLTKVFKMLISFLAISNLDNSRFNQKRFPRTAAVRHDAV